jgi:FKBP-type peptidyl-prolyl cis-trans isomerase
MATGRQVFDADKMMKGAFGAMKGPRKRKLTVCKKAILGTAEKMQPLAPHRWRPEQAEATKAGPTDPICLNWARGKDPLGRLSRKRHALPDEHTPCTAEKDIFGRDREAPVDVEKDTKVEVLFVKRTYQVDDEVAVHGGTVHAKLVSRLRENFGVIGKIEKVDLEPFSGRATIKFASRKAAEFAVEAMNAQVLLPEPRPEDAPVLTVRFPVKEDADAPKAKVQRTDSLAEVEGKEGVVSLKGTTLLYKVLKRGEGTDCPNAATKCSVHYEGQLLQNWLAGSKKTFDSSYAKGRPLEFAPNGVIKGWTIILQRMVEGDKLEVYLPPNLAYGEKGAGDDIPPNSALKFTIELIKIHPGGRTRRALLL